MGCPRAWGRLGVWRGSRAKFEGGPGGLKGFDIAGFLGDFEVADGFGPLNGGGFGEGAGVKAGLQGFVDAGAAAHGLIFSLGVEEFGDEFEIHGVVVAEGGENGPLVGAEGGGVGAGAGIVEFLAGDVVTNHCRYSLGK